MKFGNIPKAYSFKRIDSKSISEQILKNSLIFLLEGIQQIEINPKQSIVSFWTGVELFIKALLVEEHWSLIAKNTRMITQENFKKGDFVSIDFQHSIDLLENVFSVSLEKKTKKAFETIRKHRNKIIHFTNPQIENKNAWDLCDIFLEMGNVWNELQSLYLPVIDFDENELLNLYENITEAIDSHGVILEGKYQQVYEKKLAHLNCDDILSCSLCNYKAVILSPVNSVLCITKCLVCNDEVDVIKIKCDHCNNINFLHKSETICLKCHEELDLMSHIFRDGFQESKPLVAAACHRCGAKSVINIESIWFCLNCFSYHSNVSVCDFCGSPVTHSTKNSYLNGCICCEDSM